MTGTAGLSWKALGKLALSLVLLFIALPVSQAQAQSRTVWGANYTVFGGRVFTVALGDTKATITTTAATCQPGAPFNLTEQNFPSGLSYFDPVPSGVKAVAVNTGRDATDAGCASKLSPTFNGVITFSTPGNVPLAVDPQALRFHWNNLDAGVVLFSGVKPNKLAGNSLFDVGELHAPFDNSDSYVNSAWMVAQNIGCYTGANLSHGSCGTVNFISPSPTVSTFNFTYFDGEDSSEGDGHYLALSINQPSLLLRKQTVGAGGTNNFPFAYPANVVTAAATGDVAATGETIAVSASGAYTNGLQRYISNSGLDTVVSENVPANWTLTAAQCYDVANGNAVLATLSTPIEGPATASLTLAAADVTPTSQIQCDFTDIPDVDLGITKTNTPGVNNNVDQANDWVAKGVTTYTIVATNNGPVNIAGAVVKDTPGTGLTCPPANPVSITGNGVPAGSYTVADLTGAGGIALSALDSGQSATLTFECTVN
ncbi:prealbumin-like fold domain-containing protein [Caenibius tardaugens]|nr:DUF11 domain-containing protein [Caenibius tardaugens]